MSPFVALWILLATQAPPAAGGADPPSRASAEKRARLHYQDGLRLFELEQGDKGQSLNAALNHFQLAQELAPRPENLAMMGHCEYHLGLFTQARDHYEEYLKHQSTGQLAEIARQRIEAMNRRKGVLVINSVPQPVNVVLERLDGPQEVRTGQAPGEFPVSAGKWRVTVKAPKYRTESQDIEIDSVETKPLYFPLERLPQRLRIHTYPLNATLYVRGNRARNPYLQDVEPGSYEIYAEATNYESRSESFVVLPGEDREINFRLNYVQRSGRPELIWFWTAAGAVAGGVGVGAWLSQADRLPSGLTSDAESVGASATVIAGAALVGGVAGALTSTAFTPGYIRDNLALFRIGAAWIGAVEGAALGVAFRRSTASAWMGGAVGLGLGAATGRFLDRGAPNYGRAAAIQSGAAIGALSGLLAVPAFDVKSRHTSSVIFGGLNLGLGAGLALAYLPDQKQYGPTWQRVLAIDLATAAGAIGGALIKIVSQCLQPGGNEQPCAFDEKYGRPTARFALVGAGLGLGAGWLLTRGYDAGDSQPLERAPLAFFPMPTVLPVRAADGRTRVLPALAAQGLF